MSDVLRRLAFALIWIYPITCAATEATTKPAITVAFLVPAVKENPFWSQMAGFMQATAEDLNVDLKIEYMLPETDERFSDSIYPFKRQGLTFINSLEKIDYFITYYQDDLTFDLIGAVEKKGGQFFIINSAISPVVRNRYGQPREKFKNWIGHMHPDDVQAGQLLANTLIESARAGKPANAKAEIVALGGSNSATSVSNQRIFGLELRVRGKSDTQLDDIVFCEWQPVLAYNASKSLIEKYPGVNVIWAASDAMALKAIDAIEQAGKIPNKDIFTGGVDWTDEALQAIAAGKMTASVGGHFMEGGWALVLLYDYHNGIDFKDQLGVEISTQMQLITKDNVKAYLRKFSTQDWSQIDFRKFSKKHNSELKEYDFSIGNLLL